MVIQGLVPTIGMVCFLLFHLRWRLSNEKFLKEVKKIDDLSFRASYGIAGEVPRYDYLFYNTYNTYRLFLS